MLLTRRPIRDRLLLVTAFGVFTAALSGVALYRAIAVTTVQRIERARDAIGEEIDRLQAGGAPDTGATSAAWVIGMRGGVSASPHEIGEVVPAAWRANVVALADEAVRSSASANLEIPLASGHLVARVVPDSRPGSHAQRLAWGAMLVKPSPALQSWRVLVVALTVSALLLVAAAASALITVKRSAGALQASLGALAQDLSAPIPRSSLREFGDIADGIATLARHLADARKIQERLGRDLARQERLAALGRVVAGVAHEVRNPLASIKLRLDLAMADVDLLPASLRSAIVHASSEITRLDRLVADLLIVSGRPLGPRQALAAGQILRDRMEALAPWAAQRGITFRARGKGDATGNSDAVARAIDNLLRNAVDASPDGATVDGWVAPMAAVGPDAPTERLGKGPWEGPLDPPLDGARGPSPAAAQRLLSITVEDRGPGVSAGRVGELFEPFFTTKPEGTGLGLAISRAIARGHDGDLVYARVGDVTRFELTLPMAEHARAGARGIEPMKVGA